jgi:hypothetical protein
MSSNPSREGKQGNSRQGKGSSRGSWRDCNNQVILFTYKNPVWLRPSGVFAVKKFLSAGHIDSDSKIYETSVL